MFSTMRSRSYVVCCLMCLMLLALIAFTPRIGHAQLAKMEVYAFQSMEHR